MHGSLRATLAGGPAAPAFSAARPRPQHRMARPARATAASPSPSSPEVRAGLAAAGSWVRGARPASSGGGAASPHHGSGGGGARPATHTAACAYALLPRRSRLPKLSSPLPHPTAAAAGGRREHPAAAAGGRSPGWWARALVGCQAELLARTAWRLHICGDAHLAPSRAALLRCGRGYGALEDAVAADVLHRRQRAAAAAAQRRSY